MNDAATFLITFFCFEARADEDPTFGTWRMDVFEKLLTGANRQTPTPLLDRTVIPAPSVSSRLSTQ
jgi:hypothetical protein